MKIYHIIAVAIGISLIWLLVNKETQSIQPYESPEYIFVTPKDWANDSTMAPGKILTLDRIYEQGK
jgi:hypothetical protein